MNTQELQRRIALYDDEAAYRELFDRFYKPLLQFATAFTRSREAAEEAVSDVFINIWERRHQLDSIDNLPVYLYVSTRNASLKHLLKQQKRSSVPLDDLVMEPESPAPDPEQTLLTAEMALQLQQAIQQLPPRCKIVFKLIREDGLRYKEVAQILNISVKTIDNQLAIALQKIGTALKMKLKKSTKD
ncbi:RNA polymerase sigma-70 factor [Chitinophaga caseinilytica]|uniref:RNA polymerase sigma-70 factor n=1 Tax=Chitinophaga caseinilytica TaxID=2267521 RepID=A0ABZ2Z1I5_9BACT